MQKFVAWFYVAQLAVLVAACSAAQPVGPPGVVPPDANVALVPDAPDAGALPVADADADTDAAQPTSPSCAGSYGSPAEVPVAEPALVEASGLAASKRNPGVLWSHNDSGDSARIFAIGETGAALGELSLPGVTAVDFEDIATAACPDASGPCIWIADLGNNLLTRTNLAVYAVPEPAVSKAAPLGRAVASKVWKFPVAYPPGVAINVEALLVAPDASAVWVFEKVDAASARIFSAQGPFVNGATLSFAAKGTLFSPGLPVTNGRMITGGDFHPSGSRVLLRVYTGVFEYRLSPGQTPADLDAAQRVLVTYGPLSEKQGEAVTYDASGMGIWTISEDPAAKLTQPLHHFSCAP